MAVVAPWLWLTKRVKLAELPRIELARTEVAQAGLVQAEVVRTELVRTEVVWMEGRLAGPSIDCMWQAGRAVD